MLQAIDPSLDRNCPNGLHHRYQPMTDDRTKKGMQDRTRINTSEDYELRYWSEKLGVTQDQLKAAVTKVGNSVSAVEMELKAA